MLLPGALVKVVRWDGEPLDGGRPGPIARKLLSMWRADQREAADQLVAVP